MVLREFHRLAACYQAARRDRTHRPAPHGDPATAQNVVLLHNTMFGTPPSRPPTALPDGWSITTDRQFAGRAVAVVFHVPTLWRLPVRKRQGQLWVGWSMESAVNYPQLSDPAFLRRLDLRMTYQLDSDVPDVYLPPSQERDWVLPPPAKRRDQLAIALISSDIHHSGRLAYLSELMRHLDVHSYGRILNNRAMPQPDTGPRSRRALLSQYKFTLAMENSICRDYVTEKFFDPLVAGSVPVYLGAPNVGDFAPGERCYINAADFASPRHLADYLNLLNRDDQAYAEYFAWKRRPLRPAFLRLQQMAAEPVGVRLCRLLEARIHSH